MKGFFLKFSIVGMVFCPLVAIFAAVRYAQTYHISSLGLAVVMGAIGIVITMLFIREVD